MLRPSRLFLAAAAVLCVVAVLAHHSLSSVACAVAGEAPFRRDLMDRIHALALERADRTAGFHTATGRALAGGSSVAEAAAREVSAGAKALARRADGLASLLEEGGEALPADDRGRMDAAVAGVLARVAEVEGAAAALAAEPASIEALDAADGAARGLDKAVTAAREEAGGLALRADARMQAAVRKARWTGAGLAAAAFALAGFGAFRMARGRDAS